MAETPTVTIIIPAKPEIRVNALSRLPAVDYPAGFIEVIVAAGRQPSRQRNLAAQSAAGEFVYFLDDDSLPSPDFLRRAVRHFDDPSVAAAGGPSLTPDTDSVLQHAFELAFTSIIGGGGMRNRYRQAGGVRLSSDRELILCNLCFRRDLLIASGGFDERLYPNEENELMERIMREGGKLIHDPGLAVYRSQRPTVRAFCRQLFGYGRGRGEQTVLSGVIKPITFIPTIFLFYLLTLALVHKAVYYLPLLCYLIMIGGAAGFAVIRSGRFRSALWLPVIFPLFHICYGWGMLRGLVAPRWRGKPAATGEVSIRRVKDLGKDWDPGAGDLRSGTWDQ